jgi:hypothetical protein
LSPVLGQADVLERLMVPPFYGLPPEKLAYYMGQTAELFYG